MIAMLHLFFGFVAAMHCSGIVAWVTSMQFLWNETLFEMPTYEDLALMQLQQWLL